MNKIAFLFALTLTVCTGCRSAGAAGPLDALRKIKIERETILMLGGNIPPVTDFCNWRGMTCTLKPGTFGGTAAMSLTRTKSGLIAQFQFDYGVMFSDAIQAQIDDYTRMLGKPSRDSISKSGSIDFRELTWSDSSTTFELSYKYVTGREQAEASATLSDNALTEHHHESLD